jgi:integrase
MAKTNLPTGIRVRHSRSCPSRSGSACPGRKLRNGEGCEPAYEAWVYSRKDGRKIRKTFPTVAAARGWRADAQVAVHKGTLKAPTTQTLHEASGAWLKGVEDGSVLTRSGDPYKPSAIRGYEQGLRLRVLPELGAHRLSDISRHDVQHFVDRLVAKGHDASTIRNTIIPLRSIYRRAVARGEVALNPTTSIEMPAVRGRRDRIASSQEASDLLDALPVGDRPLWATAFYAGLRLGELRALLWDDLDLAKGVIHVRHSWDPKKGPVAPKSRAGIRRVPIPAALRDSVVEHRMRNQTATGLVFGRSPDQPFNPSTIGRRAKTAWKRENERRAQQELELLSPITLHEARHTFASPLMIAAGVNAKALSSYMGHSSITITLDRYGHLMPGNEAEAAELLDAYLIRADSQAQCATVAS